MLPSGSVLAVIVSIGVVDTCRDTVDIGRCQVHCLGALQGFLGSLSSIASHNGEKEDESKSLKIKTQVSNISVVQCNPWQFISVRCTVFLSTCLNYLQPYFFPQSRKTVLCAY
jgi:hypothetical protein